MYRPGESVLEEKEESTNDSLDELVEVELPDAEDVLDAAFESNEFLEHAVDFLPLIWQQTCLPLWTRLVLLSR